MENLAQEKYIEMMLQVEDAGGTAEMGEISISYGYIQCQGVMRVPREVFDRWEDRFWIDHSAKIHITEQGELTVFTVPIVPVKGDLKSDIDVEVTIVTPPYPMTLMNIFDFMH